MILVQCRCGMRFRAQDQTAGKAFACTQCGAPLCVPRPGVPPAWTANPVSARAAARQERAAPAPSPRPRIPALIGLALVVLLCLAARYIYSERLRSAQLAADADAADDAAADTARIRAAAARAVGDITLPPLAPGDVVRWYKSVEAAIRGNSEGLPIALCVLDSRAEQFPRVAEAIRSLAPLRTTDKLLWVRVSIEVDRLQLWTVDDGAQRMQRLQLRTEFHHVQVRYDQSFTHADGAAEGALTFPQGLELAGNSLGAAIRGTLPMDDRATWETAARGRATMLRTPVLQWLGPSGLALRDISPIEGAFEMEEFLLRAASAIEVLHGKSGSRRAAYLPRPAAMVLSVTRSGGGEAAGSGPSDFDVCADALRRIPGVENLTWEWSSTAGSRSGLVCTMDLGAGRAVRVSEVEAALRPGFELGSFAGARKCSSSTRGKWRYLPCDGVLRIEAQGDLGSQRLDSLLRDLATAGLEPIHWKVGDAASSAIIEVILRRGERGTLSMIRDACARTPGVRAGATDLVGLDAVD
ncbi:MAG: hypothetical protein HZA54_09030 [Planctomycetes bacterium]|nr:hypothetical protein [Planctomycetota bacterium]